MLIKSKENKLMIIEQANQVEVDNRNDYEKYL